MCFYNHGVSEYFLGRSAWHSCLPCFQPQRAKLQDYLVHIKCQGTSAEKEQHRAGMEWLHVTQAELSSRCLL